jgi:hypothetical protein
MRLPHCVRCADRVSAAAKPKDGEMSEATMREAQSLTQEPAQAQPGKPHAARRLVTTSQSLDIEGEEAALWTRLEEREEGRLAIEADHLFDTSYTWAV